MPVSGNSWRRAISSRSVPWPNPRRSTLPQSGQRLSTGRWSPQWWQIKRWLR